MERLLNLLGRALSIAGANGAGEIARRHQNDNDVGVPAIGRLDQIEMIDPSANVFDDRRNVGSPSRAKIDDGHGREFSPPVVGVVCCCGLCFVQYQVPSLPRRRLTP